MMIFKKMFLLFCLTLNVFVPNVCANEETDKKINKFVHKVFIQDAKNQAVTLVWLKSALTNLKKDVLSVLENNCEEYKELYQALQSLDLESNNLPEVVIQLRKVVNNLPEKSQKYLKNRFSILS